jgi:hypothetical protein
MPAPTAPELVWFLFVLLAAWAAERIFRRLEATMERMVPEGCITHNGPLILCEQCVREVAMRSRRTLDRNIQRVLDGPECAGLTNHQRERLLGRLLAEIEKELPE